MIQAAPQPTSASSGPRDRFLLRWMFTFLRPVWHLAALAGLYLTLFVGVEILVVRQTAQAINRIQLLGPATRVQPAPNAPPGFWDWLRTGTPGAAGLGQAVLLLAGLTAAMAMLTYLREVTNTKFTMHQVFHIRQAVYDQLQRVGLSYHDRTTTGEIINRALSDLQKVRAFLQAAVLVTLEILLIVGGYLILLIIRCPWAVPIALAPLPIWTWYTIRFSRRVRPAQRAEVEAGDTAISILTENIAGVHVVKAFAAEPQEVAKYNASCDIFLARVLTRIRMYANYAPVIRSISMVSHLGLFFLAGYLIIHRRLLPGDILMLGSAMGAILGRLQQVAIINEQYQNAIVSARRLHEMLAAEPNVPELPGAQPLPPGPGAVWFQDVTFGYDPHHPVLHGVSFAAAGGQMIAVVGPTGSGKTTLVSLLARLYDPQQGVIMVDGADVRHVTLASLRSQIAYVFQETYLFSDTVEANIAYGRPDVRGTAVLDAARIAQAAEFIETLPKGYQTLLGERGMTLSGGQRQRLSIARALATEPRILILDDALAAVDPETEELIHHGMLAQRGRTIFVVAHRLNTVKRADLVLVLEGGRITQMGTHAELMQVDGHYRAIAAAQFHDDTLDRDGESPAHRVRMRDERAVSAARQAAATPAPPSREQVV